MEMGNMGRPKQTGSRKRRRKDSRRGDPSVAALAFTDDKRERTIAQTKVNQRGEALWLGASLIASHKLTARPSNNALAREAEESLAQLAKASFGKRSQVNIEPPERGTKTWFVEIQAEQDGTPIEFEMEGASVDDVYGSALVWINYKVGVYGSI